MKNVSLGRLRIIADREDLSTIRLAKELEQNLGLCFDTDNVVLCNECECKQCAANHTCDFILAVFTNMQSETTASMISVCAQNIRLRGGTILVLEPEGHERVLPLTNEIKIPYRKGDNVTLQVIRAICAHYDVLSGMGRGATFDYHVTVLESLAAAITTL